MDSDVLWELCVLVLLGKTCVSFAGAERMSVMERDPVTLKTEVIANQHETIKWYFKDFRVAEINKDQIKICTDNKCKKRFGNRLLVDSQTGSLTITDTRTTDSGEYHLDIINSGKDSEKTFNVKVTLNGVSTPEDHQMKSNPVTEGESGLSSAAVAGICVGILFVAAAAAAAFGVIYFHKRRTRTRTQRSDQENGVTHSIVKHADNGLVPVSDGYKSADTNDTLV